MTTIFLPQCQPIAGEPLEPLTIQIEGPVKTDGLDYGGMRKMYREYGRIVCRQLLIHLPGGLFDALLLAMMEEKASLFRVPYIEPEGK